MDSRRRARQTRRFYTLTAASTLIPGLGLIPTRRRPGRVIVGAFVLGLVAMLLYVLVKGVTNSVISVGASRTALMVAVPVMLVATVVWIGGIIMTARDNLPEGSTGRPKVAMVIFTAFAALLIFAPAAQSMRYAVIQHSLIGSVFDNLRPDGAAAPGDGDDPWSTLR